jgi:hypothetical protein
MYRMSGTVPNFFSLALSSTGNAQTPQQISYSVRTKSSKSTTYLSTTKATDALVENSPIKK